MPLPAELLEILSNQTELSPQSAIVAPSIILRDIWMKDREFKSFYESMFASLHDCFRLAQPKVDKDGTPVGVDVTDVSTDIPDDLKTFYYSRNIHFKNYAHLQRKINGPIDVWLPALTPDQIKSELLRQGVEKPSLALDDCPRSRFMVPRQ